MTFAFDERYAMFDVTPVENQFILEYLAGAKGDYVKVYLYGLLCCYHPRKEMDIASMSRELELTEDVRGTARNRIMHASAGKFKALLTVNANFTEVSFRHAMNGRKIWD